jgi:hypothetical protein
LGDTNAEKKSLHNWFCSEGPEGVKWELHGICLFLGGKMGFHALGLGFISKKTIENGNGIKI